MTPWKSATSSKVYCIAESMPSPSRSNLTSPISAQSSLSHCKTVRPGIRPHSTGQTSITGRSHITIPPEWMPRCRGAFCNSSASETTIGGTSVRSSAVVRPSASRSVDQ